MTTYGTSQLLRTPGHQLPKPVLEVRELNGGVWYAFSIGGITKATKWFSEAEIQSLNPVHAVVCLSIVPYGFWDQKVAA